jgi:hypothetical protein
MSKIPTTSPFATAKASEVESLIAVGLELTGADGIVPWDEIAKHTEVGYSRGWLIVRRAWLEVNAPELLIPVAKLMADATAQATTAGTLGDFNAKSGGVTNGERRVLGPVVQDLRTKNNSWGEIAVRLGMPESRVRAIFKASGSMKDLGLRIGKGGRFALGDPTLYLDNRRKEGAQIPADFKGRPAPEQLLNYRKPEAPAAPKAKRTTKAS